MINVVASMKVCERNLEKLMVPLKELVSKTVVEDGCVSYKFGKVIGAEDDYAIIETWESQSALDVHLASEHFTRIIPQVEELIDGDLDIKVFEVLL